MRGQRSTGHGEADAFAVLRFLWRPVCFVLGHWALWLRRDAVTGWLPQLWSVSGQGALEVLPPHPATRTQAFKLGRYALLYEMRCSDAAPDSQRRAKEAKECADILESAGAVVGATKPLTAAQLYGMERLIGDMDAQKSLVDRVVGFFSFVNVVWTISIVGLICTIGPCLAYLCGPALMRVAGEVYQRALRPAARLLHHWGVFEVAVYAVAFLFSAQSCRYPAALADPALMVGLTGGLAFAPCWAYSASRARGGGGEKKFAVLSFAMAALELAPLALIHDSRLMGFLTVLSVYGALGFVFFAFGFGFAVGFDGKDALHRCLAASVVLVVGFASAKVMGLQPGYARPFVTGVMVLGNNMYFLALLIECGAMRGHKKGTYLAKQGAMAASLLAALFVGSVFAMPSMSNTATTYLVLYLMEKELEVRWGPGLGVVVMFCNFVGLYYIAHYLHTHPQHIASLFDGAGLYM